MKEKARLGSAFEEPTYTFRGFEALPEDMDHMEDKFYGFVFQDSDFSKWIEAVAYSLINHPDPELEAVADGAIDIVCEAQLDNGYLDTYYIINGMDKSFSNLKDHHELYCFGHLTEGAVAYYEATGKDKLLHAAMRFADYIDSVFGPEEGKCKGYPGHEIAEMALVRLYQVTGEERYLNLSRFFIEQRGTKPYYFDKEELAKKVPDEKFVKGKERYLYYQSHRPVRQQDEAVGHAVRAVYLYSGMTDIARLTQDDSLFDACKTLWDSAVNEKMYITGAIGATQIGESFSHRYDLPNDLAYSETCASIGLMFFARRMLEIEPDSRYADVMEQALYNTVLSGMALDGKSFFYVNPLEVVPEDCHLDKRKEHVKPVRQKWFGCACCPPNLARLVSSIPSYAYTETEDTLYMHLHLAGTVEKEVGGIPALFEVESGFPWNGTGCIRYQGEDPVTMKLAIRIPGWCRNWHMKAEGAQLDCRMENGYYILSGCFTPGTEITFDFPMEVRFYQADDRVREDLGKAAVMRGPVVFCAEGADNGEKLHMLRIDPKATVTETTVTIEGQEFPALIAKGFRRQETKQNGLYREYQDCSEEPVEITLIPYYTWANRGENEMMVWMKV